jgi:predicted transposase/invertase (TIGR01784 family)
MVIKERYIDPFTDFGFKRLFGSIEHKKLLISFLNDLLDIEYKIVDIEYRNLEKLGMSIVDRKAVFDIYCTDEKKNSFIVELQRAKQEFFKDRSIYYTSFPIQEQSKRGDWNYMLKRVFFIGILDFEMEDSSNHYLSKVQLCDTETKEPFYNKLTYYYIEMPKFKKSEEELSNHLEYWLYFLNNLVDLSKIPEKLEDDEIIKEAFDIAEFLALDKDEQFAYQQDLKSKLDYKNSLDYAKKEAKNEGRKLGIQLGIKKGMQQGIQQGKQIGIKEGEKLKAIEIAKNLLDVLDIETVSKKTNLTIDEIKALKGSS